LYYPDFDKKKFKSNLCFDKTALLLACCTALCNACSDAPFRVPFAVVLFRLYLFNPNPSKTFAGTAQLKEAGSFHKCCVQIGVQVTNTSATNAYFCANFPAGLKPIRKF
jgi:hypothetical protein